MRFQIFLNSAVAFLTLGFFFITLNVSTEKAPENATVAAMCVVVVLLWLYEVIDWTALLPVAASVSLVMAVTIAHNWLGVGFAIVLALLLLIASFISCKSFAKEQKLNQKGVLAIMIVQFTITSLSMQLGIREYILRTIST